MIPSEKDIAAIMESSGMERMQAINHLRQREWLRRHAAPTGARYRISSESAWPLRDADGRTFADRKERP